MCGFSSWPGAVLQKWATFSQTVSHDSFLACCPTADHAFFETISSRICRSKLSPATNRFSRTFSSCSCLNWRTRSVSRPLPCFFQRYRGLLRDPDLSDHFCSGYSQLSLPQQSHDLFCRKAFPLHGRTMQQIGFRSGNQKNAGEAAGNWAGRFGRLPLLKAGCPQKFPSETGPRATR
jgi:hypothetical protein